MKTLILILLLASCQKEVIYPPDEPKNTQPHWVFIGTFDITIYRQLGTTTNGHTYNIKDSLILEESPINVLITSKVKTSLLVKRNDSIYYKGVTDRLYIKSK